MQYMVHWANQSAQLKRYFDRFSHFAGRTIVTDRETDRQTDHTTSVTSRIYVRSNNVVFV